MRTIREHIYPISLLAGIAVLGLIVVGSSFFTSSHTVAESKTSPDKQQTSAPLTIDPASNYLTNNEQQPTDNNALQTQSKQPELAQTPPPQSPTPKQTSTPKMAAQGSAEVIPAPKPATPTPVTPPSTDTPKTPASSPASTPVTPPATPPKPSPEPAASCSGSFVNEFLCLLNGYRADKGLNKLSGNLALSNVALGHSEWMNSTGTFSHTGINGSRLGDRCRAAGITCRGENLAYNASSPQNLLDMWIASPGHNKILLGDYTITGLGISGAYITLLMN